MVNEQQPPTIFYSWQSESPNCSNRGFILDALKKALRHLATEGHIVEPDRDTDGVPGSPDIVETIFRKIDSCSIFLADLTITHRGGAPILEQFYEESGPVADLARRGEKRNRFLRPAANSNVLFETGYALKSIGRNRMLVLQNSFYGSEDPKLDIPFDLQHTRLLYYRADPGAPDRTAEKKRLVVLLIEAIRIIILGLPVQQPPDPLQPILELIQTKSLRAKQRVEKFFLDLMPQLQDNSEPNLVVWLESTLTQASLLFRLVDECGCYAGTGLDGLQAGFSQLMQEHWNLPYPGYPGYSAFDHDKSFLLGYVLFTGTVATLMKREYYQAIDEFLSEATYTLTLKDGQSHNFDFVRFSHGGLADNTHYYSAAGRLLRNANWPSGEYVSFADFRNADFLMMIRTSVTNPNSKIWFPWTYPYIGMHEDLFITEISTQKRANVIAPALGLKPNDPDAGGKIQAALEVFAAPFRGKIEEGSLQALAMWLLRNKSNFLFTKQNSDKISRQ